MTYQKFVEYRKRLVKYILSFEDYNDLMWFLEGITAQDKLYPKHDE